MVNLRKLTVCSCFKMPYYMYITSESHIGVSVINEHPTENQALHSVSGTTVCDHSYHYS
ncbi:hypothetical protein PDY_19660 [Photobacterium damselae subsp. damselae]|nr:hypothetical protein PDY_19660 [Photobacterium damselae subsp. damselae]